MNYILIGSLFSLVIVAAVYHFTGWQKIIDCYQMWFTAEYWKTYNIIEALSWLTKAIIIVPGLIFGIEIWWLYLFTLVTSVTLIWASNQKLLPTLVGFNSLWVWLSCVVLAKSLL
jgi:hypothetical protein